jgi:predicted transcriptional regulator
MNRTTLVELTADIASAHVSHNSVAVSDLPGLIKRVHDSLAGLSGPKLEASERSAPIVSVKASVRPDYLVCLRCGTKKKMLKRHLSTAHGYTPGEYRSEYGLAASYPMVSSNHSTGSRAHVPTLTKWPLSTRAGRSRPCFPASIADVRALVYLGVRTRGRA